MSELGWVALSIDVLLLELDVSAGTCMILRYHIGAAIGQQRPCFDAIVHGDHIYLFSDQTFQ
jgi:hypothetical protein